MLFFKKLILFSLSVFLLLCKRKYVENSPVFDFIRSNIDSITVSSDALVAIDTKNDFYTVKASLFFDSLTIDVTTKALTNDNTGLLSPY